MSFPQRPSGLVDVAAHAGVSVSTVSRVLSGRTPVSAKLREKVMTAVRELDYHPNAAAQALVSGRRSTVAVLARNTIRYGYAATLQGIEEAARAAHYVVMIAVVESRETAVIDAAIASALSQPLAGAIVLEFDEVGTATLQAMPSNIPVVAAAGARRDGEDRPHAFLDDATGGYDATRYLLGLGHPTVHHLAIPATRPGAGREAGWRRALAEAGAPVPEVIHAGYSPRSGYEAVRDADLAGVTALLCGNDELAIGAMRALRDQGRRVPEDVSVVGFDDQSFAAMWTPALTTMAQDFTDLGRRTFGLLRSWLDTDRRPAHAALTPRLVERESAAPPRIPASF